MSDFRHMNCAFMMQSLVIEEAISVDQRSTITSGAGIETFRNLFSEQPSYLLQ